MNFIMFYEHHAREVDGLLLLKAELAKRGHTAEIVHYTFGRRWMYHRFVNFDVAVVPFLYNDRALAWTMSSRIPSNKIVNLQWEQITFSKDKSENIVPPQGVVRCNATHLCWGEKSLYVLRNTSIAPERIHVTGALHLDLCTEPFRSYYRTKLDLVKKTGLSCDKRWLLFVSDMAFANDASLASKACKELYADYIAYIKRCLKAILAWVRRYCVDHPDVDFIYRPHPAERVTDEVIAAADKVGNFHIIRDGAAREWVIRSDVCFVHGSSTIAEIYAAGKSCGILRPEPCLVGYGLPVYTGCKSIATYEEFAQRCDEGNTEFPVSGDNFREYYDHRRDLPGYLRICDVLEEVLKRKAVEPDVISFLERSDDARASTAIREMDKNAFFSDLFRNGEIKMAGLFLRVMGIAHVFGFGFSDFHLKDWPKRSEIPEKQKKLCGIIGAPELPDAHYLERALEAHRRGEDWNDIELESYDALINDLGELIDSPNPEPETLFELLADLFPLSNIELDDYGKCLLNGHVGKLATATLKLLRCEDYPSWEEDHMAVSRFVEPLCRSKHVIMYGAGGYAPQVKSACSWFGVTPTAIWDRRAEELKSFEGIPVAPPFSDEPGEDTLVLIALSYNRDYYPVRDELLHRGYKVMDGAMALACAIWERALNEK